MSQVKIAEATGFAGRNGGPIGPLVELAMHRAVAAAMDQGVADDTSEARVFELTGVKGKNGGEYIRDAKLAARNDVRSQHKALISAAELAKAAELHNARDD